MYEVKGGYISIQNKPLEVCLILGQFSSLYVQSRRLHVFLIRM